MPTTAINALRSPAGSDAPNIPQYIQNLAADVDPHLISWFATTAARDAAITSPRDGQIAYIDNEDYYYKRVAGAWVKSADPIGLIAYGELGSTASVGSAVETRIAGAHNISPVTLVTGRAYEAVARGLANIDGSAGLIQFNLRAARGATPTTTSPVVATDRVYCPAIGGSGQVAYDTSGQPFQVATSGTNWQIHLFGDIITGGTTMDSVVDARGVFSISVYDCGIATAGTRTV